MNHITLHARNVYFHVATGRCRIDSSDDELNV